MGPIIAQGVDTSDDDLVEIGVAEHISGLSQSTIRRKIKDPRSDFPRPVQLSERRRKWIRGELRSWREARMRARVAT